MWTRLRQHWPAKLGSLLAAAVLWYFLHQAILAQSDPAPTSPAPAAPSGRFP